MKSSTKNRSRRFRDGRVEGREGRSRVGDANSAKPRERERLRDRRLDRREIGHQGLAEQRV